MTAQRRFLAPLALSVSLVLACTSDSRPNSLTVAAPPRSAAPGKEFIAETRALSRVVACSGNEALPTFVDTGVVGKHCALVAKQVAAYQQRWLRVAVPWLAARRPVALPDKIVYPFGGGDLLAALAVFPSATEFTAVSLEAMGDPRMLADSGHYARHLVVAREVISLLLTGSWNTTLGLSNVSAGMVPGELLLDLIALEAHGYEPISLRYFRLQPGGTIHYLEEAELAEGIKADAARAGEKKGENDLSHSIWNDAELQFRKRGDPSAPVKTFRHMARNLSNAGMKGDGLLPHLKAKGKVAAMTKAASYLLWGESFSDLRNYLLANAVWMVSDVTGIAPVAARSAGFTVTGYGRFDVAYFTERRPDIQESYRVLLEKAEPLPFLFGYFDKKFQRSMVVIDKTGGAKKP